MEKKVREDEVSFRQAENQLVRLGTVFTANDRKSNRVVSRNRVCFFFTKQKTLKVGNY